MKFSQLLAILLFIATYSLAQSTPASVYAESFRQGPTHIVEEKFEVKLTPQDATYRERIKDSSGHEPVPQDIDAATRRRSVLVSRLRYAADPAF